MALTTNVVQVEWSSNDSVSVAASSNETSDAFAISQTCFQATVQLKADNDGMPVSGDTVDFYLLPMLGDPDGAGSDQYATGTQGIHLARLNTVTDDPAITVVPISMPLKGGKIYAVNHSGGRAITVSAIVMEHRSS